MGSVGTKAPSNWVEMKIGPLSPVLGGKCGTKAPSNRVEMKGL